jgi:2-methylcitrate dehydratase PrpD
VRRIRVGVNRQSYEAVCTPVEVRKAPKTLVQAQFSIPYTVATALLDGAVRLGHFTEASLGRADVLALAQRVEGFVDDDIERQWGRSVTPAQMHVEFDDGTVRSMRVDLPLGHPSRPMSPADQVAKAVDCFAAAAVPLAAGASDELHLLVMAMEAVDDVRSLTRILTPAS